MPAADVGFFHGFPSFSFLLRPGKAGRRPPADAGKGQGEQDALPRMAQAQPPHQLPPEEGDQRLRRQGEDHRLVRLPQAQHIQHLAGGGAPAQKAQVKLHPQPGADAGGLLPPGAVGDGDQELQLGETFHIIPPQA